MNSQTAAPEYDSTKRKVFSYAQLRSKYEARTAHVIAECEFATEVVGGVNATKEGVEWFVKQYLKLTDDPANENDPHQATDAVNRILTQEFDVPTETGELEEKLTYGINTLRKSAEHGPWLGNWMIKACVKGAASRLEIFQKMKGSKGDVAEVGEVRAYGASLKEPNNPERVYLLAEDSDDAAKTEFHDFKGSVSSPKGRKSIANNNEVALPGTRFQFEFRYYPKLIKENDIVEIFAFMMVIGLGSCKAFDRGRFKINQLTWEPAKISPKDARNAKATEEAEPEAEQGLVV